MHIHSMVQDFLCLALVHMEFLIVLIWPTTLVKFGMKLSEKQQI